MDGAAIVAVSAAVVALTQLVKWSGLPDRLGPLAVLGLSLLGVVFWAWSKGTFQQQQAFDYFAGWIAISTSAAGVFGFTRAGGEAVSRMTAPPSSGAGSSPTLKS
jgi:O-antigen/teichoic acid export membrane protein